jgi:hypothetical protein
LRTVTISERIELFDTRMHFLVPFES